MAAAGVIDRELIYLGRARTRAGARAGGRARAHGRAGARAGGGSGPGIEKSTILN